MIRDPGLQPERTALAWHRTALAMSANAVLVLRSGLQSGEARLMAAGAALAVPALAFLLAGELRRRQLTRGARAPARRLVAFASVATLLAALAGLASLLP